MVLLHLLHELAPRFDWHLSALHVHHGISPHADAWAEFCAGLCAHRGIPLLVERVDIAPLRDAHGIEAAARKLRHAALARQDCDFVALAHHADDQAETLLLQLLRGAGIKGVAAMSYFKSGDPAILRPLLGVTRAELESHARQHELNWVEDESNADDSYPRNFLRHRVLPLLGQRFPAWRETLPRCASHFAEASGLLDDLAELDAQAAMRAGTLEIGKLRSLALARAKNLLRFFLHLQGAPMPQAMQLEDMLRQLLEARGDAQVCVEYGGWEVRRYQDRVFAMPALGGFNPELELGWNGEGSLWWPPLQQNLSFTESAGQGISLKKLRSDPVTLRLRGGGEALRPHPEAATRSLKNLMQEHQVPPWQRERLPLLFCGDELACVVGVEVAAAYRAGVGEAGLVVALTPM